MMIEPPSTTAVPAIAAAMIAAWTCRLWTRASITPGRVWFIQRNPTSIAISPMVLRSTIRRTRLEPRRSDSRRPIRRKSGWKRMAKRPAPPGVDSGAGSAELAGFSGSWDGRSSKVFPASAASNYKDLLTATQTSRNHGRFIPDRRTASSSPSPSR